MAEEEAAGPLTKESVRLALSELKQEALLPRASLLMLQERHKRFVQAVTIPTVVKSTAPVSKGDKALARVFRIKLRLRRVKKRERNRLRRESTRTRTSAAS
jgi:hypothetical protein